MLREPMLRIVRFLFVNVVLASILVPLLPGEAQALPAFARKYGVKCTTCHVQFPKLNSFGIAFKNRGYRMAGEEGEFLWDSKVFPIAAIGRFGYNYTYTKGSGGVTQTSEIVDGSIEIFSGGTLAPRISYFVDALTADNLALLQFDDILPNSALNIKAGIYNVDNYYLSHPRRLTESTYLVQTTADRGDNVTFSNTGIELNGQIEHGLFRYILGVGNDSTDADTSNDRFGNMLYLLVNHEFLTHTVSFLFRKGRTGNAMANNGPGPNTSTDTYTYGGNIDLHFGDLNIIAAIYQFDVDGSALDFIEGGRTVNYSATSGTVEAIYEFTEKFLALARFDWHNTHHSAAEETQYVASLQYHLFANVKLNWEYVEARIRAGGNTMLANVDSRTARFNIRFGF